MRRRMLTLFAVAMTALTLLTPSFASARQTGGLAEDVILDETSRNARTILREIDGCLTTSIHIGVSDDHQDWNDGSTYDHEMVSMFAWQEDTCRDEMVFEIEFYSDQIPFKISNNLSGASVSGQGIGNNIPGDDLPISFDVKWSPHGPVNTTADDGEVVVFNPLTGENVTAMQDATMFERSAKARGTIKIGDQRFRLSDRSEDTFFHGFNNTWTMISE